MLSGMGYLVNGKGGVIDLMRIPGLGPKKAMLLYEKLGVKGHEELEKAICEGRLFGLPSSRSTSVCGYRLVQPSFDNAL